MTTDHDDVIELLNLDFHVLRSDGSPERPYLLVTSDSATAKILDLHTEVRPNQVFDSQPDNESKTD